MGMGWDKLTIVKKGPTMESPFLVYCTSTGEKSDGEKVILQS